MSRHVDVRLLGSGGWLPTSRRQTSCLYVRDGADALLVDAGAGAGRLFEQAELLDGVERLFVVLTHWHLDHTFGVGFLSLLPVDVELHVWAPGETALGTPARDLLRRLLDPPFFSPTHGATERLFEDVRDLEEGETEIGPFRVRARLQRRHGTPSLALRLDGLAYCTDTAYDEGNVELARGARVLFHEAVHGEADSGDEAHASASDAARIAAAAGVERLVLIHVHPALPDDEDLLRHARAIFPRVEVGRDGPVELTFEAERASVR